MAQWTITFNQDNGTSQITIDAARKPELDDATRQLLAWAEEHLPVGEYGDSQDVGDEPAVRLLRRFGVTVTGINRA